MRNLKGRPPIAAWAVWAVLVAACNDKPSAVVAAAPDAAGDTGSLGGADAGVPDSDAAADSAPDLCATPTADAASDSTTDVAQPADIAQPADAAADTGDSADTAKWYACSVDADCGTVEVMCCDHCNGGKAVPVNKQFGADVKAALSAKACDGVMCTEKACAPLQTACLKDTCVVAGSPCPGLDEAECGADAACMSHYGKTKEAMCAGQDPTKVFLGCSTQKPCAQAFGCATSPAGDSFAVSQLCAPAGWTVAMVDCCKQGCKPAEAAKVCVRGKPVGAKEQVGVGDAVEVTVYPKGCYSSSCTEAMEQGCSIGPSGDNFNVTAQFCLLDTSKGGPCTADCGGGGFANCKNCTWTAGVHTVSLGGMSVAVTVPGEVPAGGACVVSPF